MLSVVIASGDPEYLPALLAALTPAAVEGLVGDLRIVAQPSPLVDALCDATGAELSSTLVAAAAAARSDWLLVLPAEFRPREGWLERLGDHLRSGGGDAVLKGRGWLGPSGFVVRRAAVSAQPDLKRLRRSLGARRVRL